MHGTTVAVPDTRFGDVTQHKAALYSGKNSVTFEFGAGLLWDGKPVLVFLRFTRYDSKQTRPQTRSNKNMDVILRIRCFAEGDTLQVSWSGVRESLLF
jgi:hypothetical protein